MNRQVWRADARAAAVPAALPRPPPAAHDLIPHGQVRIGLHQFKVKRAVGDPDGMTEREVG